VAIRALTTSVAIVRCDCEGCEYKQVYLLDDELSLAAQLEADCWLTLPDVQLVCAACQEAEWVPAHPPTGSRAMPGLG
jgi:hypothetical protein